MTTRVETNEAGELVATTIRDAGHVTRSTDYQSDGVTVQRGAGQTSVAAAEHILDDDLVTVDGVQMSARMAREYGVLDKVFNPSRTPDQLDPGLNAGSATQQAGQTRQDPEDNSTEKTGHEGLDTLADDLNKAVESGEMEPEEAHGYYNAVGELALAGLNMDQGIELISKIQSGETADIPSDHQHVAAAVERGVTEAATRSAQSELGPQAFEFIRTATESSREVADSVRGFAIRRATGRANGLTWADLYADVVDHMQAR